MKRLTFALLALFIQQVPVSAQQQDARTTTTKIADLLAQQPADNAVRLEEAMGQLERFTTTDIATLLKGLMPPGEGNNAGIEYAANTYSYHVLLPGKESQRATFIQGAIEALAALDNPDNKGFVIQLLQNAGDDTAVDALSPYLTDAYLSEKAARALSRIGTDRAGSALQQALEKAEGIAAVHITDGLGFMSFSPAEHTILAKANTSEVDLRRVSLYALSRIGGTASQPLLAEAAKSAGYRYEPTEATSAYINYLHTQVVNGETAAANKAAASLFKEAQKVGQVDTYIAALGLLTDIRKDKQVNTLLKASRDENTVYRNAALSLLSPYLNNSVTSKLVKKLDKSDAQIQVDLLRYVASQKQTAALPAVNNALTSAVPAVRVAAVHALHQLAPNEADERLIALLPDSDNETREAIKQALLTSENPQLVSVVNTALQAEKNAAVQILLIDVLGQRGAGESVPTILSTIGSDASADVKAAAFGILPQIVRSGDLNNILDLLTDANQSYAASIQAAAVAAIVSSTDRNAQTKSVISRFEAADAKHKPFFFPILSGVGGEDALRVVSGYTDQSDPRLRGAATSALANWVGEEALPQLIELSRRKVTDTEQIAAIINGLVRLIAEAQLPDDQKVLYLRETFDAAETAEQRKSVLRALEANKTYNALQFAGKFLYDEQLQSTAANTVMNIALDRKDFYGPDVVRLLNRVIELLSGSESSYLREAIEKHLNELPKGRGYASLFNGKDLTGWKGLVADPIKRSAMDAKTLAEAQVKADEVMRSGWSVQNGELFFNGHGDNIATVQQYGDFEMLVDWKLAKEGKDGDAGIYLRGTPQVQIWDTSRVNVGAQVGSGGLYNNQKYESKPLKVADNPLGEWNTFRIRMVGDRVTVYLNGELVTDSVVLENYWDRNRPIFPREQIELQAHGTHVFYRDIFIRELPRKEVYTLSESEKQEGFEMLFDGTNLDSWMNNTDAYSISEEGTLAVVPIKGSGGNLYTKEEYADFIYRFEFRLTPGANNGIGIRAPLGKDAAYAGMEIQVLDDGAEIYKNIEAYQHHGSVYGVIPAKQGYLRPVGEWNEEEIYVKGNHVRVTLNGTVIVDGDIAEASKNGTLDHKEHPGLKRTTGHIGFLGHGSEVHFRNIRVKRL